MNGVPDALPAARVDVVRGGVVESRHRAVVSVARPDGSSAHAWGETGLVTYLRSAAKPFQAMPLIASGAADAFGVPPHEVALAAGSHNGEATHVEAARRLLARIGLGEDALQCGRHPPFHKPTAKELGDAYTAIHHNCSGKHAGMLAACVHRGWSTKDYLDPDHPVQQEILDNIAWASGLDPAEVRVGVDGCGVPTFAVSVGGAARAFGVLASAPSEGDAREVALARVRDAMRAHPAMVAGEDRLDTKIMRAAGGRVVVKAGAEACYGAALLEPRLGVAIKVVDGASRAVGPILGAVLQRTRVLPAEAFRTLKDELEPTIRNHAGRDVGRIRPHLP